MAAGVEEDVISTAAKDAKTEMKSKVMARDSVTDEEEDDPFTFLNDEGIKAFSCVPSLFVFLG